MKHLLLCLVLIGASPAWAEVLTLEAAIEAALDGPLLAAAEASAEAASSTADAVRLERWPRLRAGVDGQRTDQPVAVFGGLLSQERFVAEDFDPAFLNRPPALTDWRGSLEAGQLLSDGGRLGAAISAADERSAAASRSSERVRQEVIFRVVQRYAEAVAAEREVAVAEAARTAAARHAELARLLFEGGLAVESDALLAKVRVSELDELLVRARSDREVARSALELELGRPLDTSLELPEELPERRSPALDVAELKLQAANRRPDLAAFARHAEATRWEAVAAQRFRRPTIRWRAGLEHHSESLFGDGGASWGAGFQVSVPLLDRPAAVRASAASAELRAVEEQLRRRRGEIDLEVERAVAARRAAEERLPTVFEAIQWAERGLAIVTDRYGEGLATIVDLLDAESALTRATAREVAARRDLLVTAAALELAVGGTEP